ncbi:MAG: DUF1574 family protein [Gemmataceae bacterium]
MASTRKPRRGRRVFLWMLGAFFAVQIAAGMLLDRVWPQLRFSFLYKQLDRLEEQPVPPTVVCLGSSRFGCGIAGDHMTDWLRRLTGDPNVSVFNASIPAGDLLVSELMMRRLLERGVRPRFAVIELCPEVLNHRNDWLKIHLHRHLVWTDVPRYFTEITLTGNLMRLLTHRLLPLYQYREDICKELEESLQAKLDGWMGKTKEASAGPGGHRVIDWDSLVGNYYKKLTDDQREKTNIGLYDVRRCLRSYQAGGNAGAALERLLNTCAAHGVTPVLIGVPVSEPQRQLYVPAIEESYRSYVADVVKRHGCRYLDMRDRVPDALFVDNHHMVHEGSLFFSKMLTEEALLPLWRAGK